MKENERRAAIEWYKHRAALASMKGAAKMAGFAIEALENYHQEVVALSATSDKSEDCYVKLSEKVVATYYDDEYEEYLNKKVSIENVLDGVCEDYTIYHARQIKPDEQRPAWIPVSERLPDDDMRVLVDDSRQIEVMKWDLMRGCFYDNHAHGHEPSEILAWMPLPGPYRGPEEQGGGK